MPAALGDGDQEAVHGHVLLEPPLANQRKIRASQSLSMVDQGEATTPGDGDKGADADLFPLEPPLSMPSLGDGDQGAVADHFPLEPPLALPHDSEANLSWRRVEPGCNPPSDNLNMSGSLSQIPGSSQSLTMDD